MFDAMAEVLVDFLSECGWAYVKLAVALYTVCHIIEEVLGKYRRQSTSTATAVINRDLVEGRRRNREEKCVAIMYNINSSCHRKRSSRR